MRLKNLKISISYPIRELKLFFHKLRPSDFPRCNVQIFRHGIGHRPRRRSLPRDFAGTFGTGLCIFMLFLFPAHGFALKGGAYTYRFPPKGVFFDDTAKTVIGAVQKHIVKKRETFLDIARSYDLGFNELEDLYPKQDPWIPPEGMQVVIPSQWILPEAQTEGIVINVAELRLYYFMRKIGMVKTFPIGIGDEGWYTPLGIFRVQEKRVHPVWYIPESLQEKYGAKTMPPGPDNPLGDYYIGLSRSGYGIHGTNIAWSVGRLVTHGCIRLYPEDIRELFTMVKPEMSVEIVYEPVKFGILSGRIFVEVHKDIYGRIGDVIGYAYEKLKAEGLREKIDYDKFNRALIRQDGLPVDITLSES